MFIRISSLQVKHPGISQNILFIPSSNKSCGDLALNIKLLFSFVSCFHRVCRMSPLISILDSILTGGNFVLSQALKMHDSLKIYNILLFSMYLLNTLRSTLALIICGSYFTVSTSVTRGENHVQVCRFHSLKHVFCQALVQSFLKPFLQIVQYSTESGFLATVSWRILNENLHFFQYCFLSFLCLEIHD